MKFLVCLLIFSLALTLGCSREQTAGQGEAKSALDDAAEAMGGWKALRAVRAQRIASEGSDWDPIQAMKPGDTRQVNSHSDTLTADFEKKAVRLERHAKLMYPTEVSRQFTEVIDGELGMLEQTAASGATQQSRLHASLRATRLRDLNRMPARVLLTAAQAEGLSRLPDETLQGARYQVLQYKDSGQTVKLRIDSSTHLPSTVAYLEDDTVFGDAWNELVWSEWRDVGGVKFPYSEEQRLNGQAIRKETVQEIQNNPSISPVAFEIPQQVRQDPEVGEPIVSQWVLRRVSMGVIYQDFGRPQKAELEPLAPSVWLATGATHQTLVIEMKDHLMIVEGPLYEERSLAVIKAIKEKFPAKPIKYLVVTHFHADHSGGIRAYVAEGATVVAHSSIIPFLKTVLSSPRTVRPDSLARLQMKLGKEPPIVLEGVETMKEYTDGARAVRLYHLTPNPHVESMLLTYLPKERMTFDADQVSPVTLTPPVVFVPRDFAYYEFVKQQGLKVDRIARVHGPPLPFRQYATLIAQSPEYRMVSHSSR